MPVLIRESQSRPTKTVPTDTGTLHYPGTFPRGPVLPTEVRSEADLLRLFGPRWTTSPDPDYVTAFFRLGGSRVMVRRRVGAAAARATLAILKGASAAGTVTADDLGATGNDLRVAITADTGAGTAVFTVTRVTAGDTASEVSPALASQAEAAAWSIGSRLIDYIPGADATQWPPTTIAATALTGGADDLAGVTDATLAADLASLDRRAGPGQVIAAGKTSTAVHTALLGLANGDVNKRAILDAPVGALSTAKTAASTARAIAGAARAAMYRGRLLVQGAVAGTYLTLPWSVVQAAMLSRNDAALGNPNEAAAGEYGDPAGLPGGANFGGYVLGALDLATDAEVTELDGTGLNPIVDLFGDGTIQVDGDETLANPLTAPLLTQFANSRTAMLVRGRGYAIAASYRHRSVDAEGVLAGRYGGDLVGFLSGLQRLGAIYGTEADPGFVVDVGPNVNTAATIAAKQLWARVGARYSPGAKYVYLDIVTAAVNERVS